MIVIGAMVIVLACLLLLLWLVGGLAWAVVKQEALITAGRKLVRQRDDLIYQMSSENLVLRRELARYKGKRGPDGKFIKQV